MITAFIKQYAFVGSVLLFALFGNVVVATEIKKDNAVGANNVKDVEGSRRKNGGGSSSSSSSRTTVGRKVQQDGYYYPVPMPTYHYTQKTPYPTHRPPTPYPTGQAPTPQPTPLPTPRSTPVPTPRPTPYPTPFPTMLPTPPPTHYRPYDLPKHDDPYQHSDMHNDDPHDSYHDPNHPHSHPDGYHDDHHTDDHSSVYEDPYKVNRNTPQPSERPTPMPTPNPTLNPTLRPTPEPTRFPTPEPSPGPSPVPSSSPSAAPTVSPSASPSTSPSADPSASPSATPSSGPSASPSAAPSSSPSSSPSDSPSASPSDAPSGVPSGTPSVSSMPSPSILPSENPTQSEEPSENPTASEEPSENPTQSEEPSENPTQSEEPSEFPTQSEEPSEFPTQSEEPTEGPTVSAEPTFFPTEFNTNFPRPPTPQPTFVPRPTLLQTVCAPVNSGVLGTFCQALIFTGLAEVLNNGANINNNGGNGDGVNINGLANALGLGDTNDGGFEVIDLGNALNFNNGGRRKLSQESVEGEKIDENERDLQGNNGASIQISSITFTAPIDNRLPIPLDQYTVFGPTNTAFNLLDNGVLNYLFSNEGRDTFRDILNYHIITRRLNFNELSCGTDYIMRFDETTRTECRIGGDKFQIGRGNTNKPKIVFGDTSAINGVLHIVDRVILPKFFTSASPSSQPTGTEPTASPTRSPTSSPTKPPTRNPTTTREPTRDPTRNPTRNPTKSPSMSPSSACVCSSPRCLHEVHFTYNRRKCASSTQSSNYNDLDYCKDSVTTDLPDKITHQLLYCGWNADGTPPLGGFTSDDISKNQLVKLNGGGQVGTCLPRCLQVKISAVGKKKNEVVQVFNIDTSCYDNSLVEGKNYGAFRYGDERDLVCPAPIVISF